jgi:hypothetical protein
MATIFAANSSSILVVGKAVAGVQALDYRVVRQQGDVFALGSSERMTSYYGATRVEARLTVASADAGLDALVNSGDAFQVVGKLVHSDTNRTVAFDDCRMTKKEFAIASGGHGETVYTFTATRFREEDAAAGQAG